MTRIVKTAAVMGVAAFATAGMAACSSSSTPSNSASPTTSSASPTPSPTTSSPEPVVGATCTAQSIQSALPEGASVKAFKCGSTGDGQIAGVSYGPGNNIIFLKTTGIGGPWEVVNKNTICGTASAGLPPAVLAFCNM